MGKKEKRKKGNCYVLSKSIISIFLNEKELRKVHRGLLILSSVTLLLGFTIMFLYSFAVDLSGGIGFGGIIVAVGFLFLGCFLSEKKRGSRILTSIEEGTFIVFPATLQEIRTFANNAGEVDSNTDYFVFSISNGSRTFKWQQVFALNAGPIKVGNSCYVVAFPNGKGTYTPTQFYLREENKGITGIGSDLSRQYTEDPPPIDPQYNFY